MTSYQLFIRFLKETNSLTKYCNSVKATRFNDYACKVRYSNNIRTFIEDHLTTNPSRIIDMSFTWSDTKYGHGYWSRLNLLFSSMYKEWGKYQK